MPPKRLSPYLVKKTGDWNGALTFFSKLGLRVKTVTIKSQEEICRRLKAIVIGHLISQDLNWDPLSKKTKDAKTQKNRDKILIDTELYMNSITMLRQGNSFSVGIKKGVAYRRKGSFVSLDRVAILLEYGTTRMPARPLWKPSIDELGGFKGIRNFVASKIYEKLKTQAKGSPVIITKKKILSKI